MQFLLKLNGLDIHNSVLISRNEYIELLNTTFAKDVAIDLKDDEQHIRIQVKL